MTLPLSAAAVCAYAGIARDDVEHTLRSYDYSQINLCEFFLAEVAAYSFRRRDAGEATRVSLPRKAPISAGCR